MARKVRLGKQSEAGDSPWLRKLMPHRVAHRTQPHPVYNVGKKRAQFPEIGQRRGVAPIPFDEPFRSGIAYCCGFPHSGQNFELRGIVLPHS